MLARGWAFMPRPRVLPRAPVHHVDELVVHQLCGRVAAAADGRGRAVLQVVAHELPPYPAQRLVDGGASGSGCRRSSGPPPPSSEGRGPGLRSGAGVAGLCGGQGRGCRGPGGGRGSAGAGRRDGGRLVRGRAVHVRAAVHGGGGGPLLRGGLHQLGSRSRCLGCRGSQTASGATTSCARRTASARRWPTSTPSPPVRRRGGGCGGRCWRGSERSWSASSTPTRTHVPRVRS